MCPQALLSTFCGKWEVLSEAPKRGSMRYYLCRCACGAVREVREYVLRTAKPSTSCASCAQKGRNVTHGKTNSFEFRVWTAMKKRCYYEKHPHFGLYGGRGITVCAQWRDDFTCFLTDMGVSPYGAEGSIDRLDPNKGYAPDNCRWILKSDQAKNRRTVPLFDGYTMPELAAKLGVKYSTLRRRIAAGWPRETWGLPANTSVTTKENPHAEKP